MIILVTSKSMLSRWSVLHVSCLLVIICDSAVFYLHIFALLSAVCVRTKGLEENASVSAVLPSKPYNSREIGSTSAASMSWEWELT